MNFWKVMLTVHPLSHCTPTASLYTHCVTVHPLRHFTPTASLYTHCVTVHPLCHCTPTVSLCIVWSSLPPPTPAFLYPLPLNSPLGVGSVISNNFSFHDSTLRQIVISSYSSRDHHLDWSELNCDGNIFCFVCSKGPKSYKMRLSFC